MNIISNTFLKSNQLISYRLGLMQNMVKLPRLNNDPLSIAFGMWPCNTNQLHGERFEGRSSGCGFDLYGAFMGTIGETVERYCPAFYNKNNMFHGKYIDISTQAISPSEYALFHQKQHAFFQKNNYKMNIFDEDIELYWDKCIDLTSGKEIYVPAAFIYLPWTIEKKWITVGTSTGLAAHTNYFKAMLTALYELIERDSFVITWHQQIFSHKIIIDNHIQDYITQKFPAEYEWHFFDITYDIKIPTIFGLCFGEAEYGKFVAVGTACRGTISEALRKVILEISQTVSYFRYLLGEKKNWMPSDDFNQILNFEDHSIFYIKRPEYQNVMNVWREAIPSLQIDFQERDEMPIKERIKNIINLLKEKGYNVLLRDVTTPDVNQVGFFSLRVIVPQLLQMGGAYPFYFLGGKRLYEVPTEMGHYSRNYDELNKFPHPFP